MANKPKQQTLRDKIEKSISADEPDSDLEDYILDVLNSFKDIEPLKSFNLTTAASAKEALAQLTATEEKIKEIDRKTKALKYFLIQSPKELLSVSEFTRPDPDNISTKKH